MTEAEYLLDTHVILWAMTDSPRLSSLHRNILSGNSNYFVSAVSIWEISIKRSLGKLEAPQDLLATLEETRVMFLPVSPRHADHVANLPFHHRDPFDRLLIAQARLEQMTILSIDPQFFLYDVDVV